MFLCARSFSLNLTYALLRNDLRTNLGWFSAQHFINEAPGLQAGQFSTRTLLLRSHAVVIAKIHVIWRGAYVALKPLYTFQHS